MQEQAQARQQLLSYDAFQDAGTQLDALYPAVCHQTHDPRWGHLGAHSALGEFVDEDVRMRRQLDHLRAAVGTQHPEVAEMLQVLAECHAANGDHGLAVGALREALAIYAKHGVGKRGELAPRAAQARQALATAYLALNRPLDAEREMAAAGESFDALASGPPPALPLLPGEPAAARTAAALHMAPKATKSTKSRRQARRRAVFGASGQAPAAARPVTSQMSSSKPKRVPPRRDASRGKGAWR